MPQYVRVPYAIFSLGLSAGEFYILIYLMKFGERCYPSQSIIASKTGLSLTTVKKCLKSLKAKELIDWNPGHNGKNNSYKVDHAAIWNGAAESPESETNPEQPFKAEDPFADVPIAAADPSGGSPDSAFTDTGDLLKTLGVAEVGAT